MTSKRIVPLLATVLVVAGVVFAVFRTGQPASAAAALAAQSRFPPTTNNP